MKPHHSLVPFSSYQHHLLFTPTSHSHSHSHYIQLTQKLFLSMRDSSSIPNARKLHAQLISTGLYFSVFLQNHLLNMYFSSRLIQDASRVFADMTFRNVFTCNIMVAGLSNAGRIDDAKKMFDQMPQRDSVSWNSLMSGYFRNRHYEDVLKVFVLMFRNFTRVVNLLAFSCAMKACGTLSFFKLAFQLHGLMQKFDFGIEKTAQTSALDMYIKCGTISYAERIFSRIQKPSLFCFNSMLYGYSNYYEVGRALDLFNRMPEHNNVSWSTMISILSRHGHGVSALSMFVDMWAQDYRPNSMTLASVLSACTSISDLEWGSHLHARIVRMEPVIDIFIGNGLVDMYVKGGRLELARRVFNSLTEHNTVAFTSLISGLANYELEEEALLLFNQMREVPVTLDEFTLAAVLKVCSHPGSIFVARQLHAFTIKTGMGSFIAVGNALITMYSKCGDTQMANCVFNLMLVRNTITWTSMITALSQAGDIKNAQACFDNMSERNIITWNSMISMYVHHGFCECSLKLYAQMHRECIGADDITFVASISACADLAMLRLGIQIVAQAEKLGYGCDVSVANSAITMYSRCGEIEEAQKIFDLISLRNLVSWNSMIAGYAQNGQGKVAIEIFENMLKMEFRPDHISYISVLSGCSHSGLVLEGKHYFDSMSKDYGISPRHEHFTCMVDLLGRAGFLEQAKGLIDEMPFAPTADAWGALLSACKIHCNSKLAELATRSLLGLHMNNTGSCILLAHIYSACGKLGGVADVRKLMKEKGIRKNPGYSWIEVDNEVHVFTADDINQLRIKEICAMVNFLNMLPLNAHMDEGSAEYTS